MKQIRTDVKMQAAKSRNLTCDATGLIFANSRGRTFTTPPVLEL